MTREEAIYRLKTDVYKYADFSENPNEDEFWNAFDMAIKALEQETNEPVGNPDKLDCISRAETVQFLADHSNDFEDAKVRMAFKAASSLINNPHNLPPVRSEAKTGHWIVDGSVDCYLDKVRCRCSECGKKKNFPADYNHIKKELSISYKYPELIDNYCPNCGARLSESPTGSESESSSEKPNKLEREPKTDTWSIKDVAKVFEKYGLIVPEPYKESEGNNGD